MACRSKTQQVTRNVWSDGTGTAIYHSMLRLRTADWEKARVSLVAEGVSSSGNINVTTAAAYGDEESDFDNPSATEFPGSGTGTVITANGATYGTAYGTVSLASQMIDLGVLVKNIGGPPVSSKMEHVRITLLVDTSEEA